MNTYDLQSLESRTLFAATPGASLVNGLLTVQGESRRGNAIVVSVDNASTVRVTLNGAASTFDLNAITNFDIRGGKKNDRVTIDETGGELRTGIKITTYEGSDVVIGDVTAIKVVAGANNDKVTGSDGDDTLAGESGNDSLYGGDGDDYFQAGSGNDLLEGNAGNDDFYGNDGNDRVYGGDGFDTLGGGNGNDRLYDDNDDGAENDFYGGRGDDRFYIGDDDRIHDYQFFEDVYIDGERHHHGHHHDHDLDDILFPF